MCRLDYSQQGWISKNFKTFILKLKFSFLSENHKNDNYGKFPDFYFVLNQIYELSSQHFQWKVSWKLELAMSRHIDLFGITLHYSEIRNSESKSCEAVQSHSNDNPASFIVN